MDFVGTPAYYVQVKRGGLFLEFLTHFPYHVKITKADEVLKASGELACFQFDCFLNRH